MKFVWPSILNFLAVKLTDGIWNEKPHINDTCSYARVYPESTHGRFLLFLLALLYARTHARVSAQAEEESQHINKVIALNDNLAIKILDLDFSTSLIFYIY